jgi:hypothetical protein
MRNPWRWLALVYAVGLLLGARGCTSAHATPPEFDDVSALDGVFIVNETISDNPASPAVPFPVTWNPAVSAFDFSPFTVCVTTGVSIPGSVPRSASSGAVLISPSFALVAHHVPGTGESYVWMRPDGVEVERSRVGPVQLVPAAGVDAAIIRLNVPVTTIEPAAILTDSAAIGGELVACIEHDRHINVMTLGRAPGFSAITNDDLFSVVWRPAVDGDAIEGGDSGKTCFAFIDGAPVVVLSNFSVAGTSGANVWGDGSNPSACLAQIAAIVQAGGETLTLVDSAPDPPTPGKYALQASGAALTVGGTPISTVIE